MTFPKSMDPDFFDRTYRLQSELWRDSFLELWRKVGPDADRMRDFRAFTDGSNLIAAFGDGWIMKVFPPFLRHQWESEWQVMQHLDGRVAVPIPRYHQSGEAGDWTYIIMSRLPGVTLEKVWPRLPDEDKAAILRDIGRIMALVHAVPVGALAVLPPLWSDFFPRQIAGCRARHERLGMPDWFTRNVESFVREALPLMPSSMRPVVLTGEYTPFNLLVEDADRVQAIAGMIDFGDAMVGYHEYDFLGPLLFSCEGKPVLVNALFEGYGYAPSERTRLLRRRLMLLQILHRYSDFKAQVRIPHWQDQVRSIEELENLIWPLT